MSDLETQQNLHARLASGLGTLLAQREREPLEMQLERELSNPDKSFMAYMQALEREEGSFYLVEKPTKFIRKGSDTEDIVAFRNHINVAVHRACEETKWADKVYDNETGRLTRDTLDLFMYSALSEARKMVRDKSDVIGRVKGLFIAASIAALTLPEGYDAVVRPKKHKGETNQEVIFRKAIAILYDTDHAPRSRQWKLFSSALDKLTDLNSGDDAYFKVMSHPDNEDLRQGQGDVVARNIAGKLLERLAEPDFTPDRVREEDYKFAQLKNLREKPEPEPAIEETQWTILPPGTMEELEKTGRPSSESSPYFIDPERIKWLARIAIAWGPEAYIAVADLQASGDAQYYAAVLPQKVGGVLIEHAIAENASSHNATYVFRAERGIDEDGTPWLTWKDVLKDTKSGARALGARKILHGIHWEENVPEYLTRPVTELENKDYKR